MCRASTAIPRGRLAPVMNAWSAFPPSRSARPIVPPTALVQYRCWASTATPRGELAGRKPAFPLVPSRFARPIALYDCDAQYTSALADAVGHAQMAPRITRAVVVRWRRFMAGDRKHRL